MNIYDNIKDLRDADSFKDARVFHNDYDDIKLTNFGFNMRMSSIMGTLATSGIVYSTIGVLGAITLLSLPADLGEFCSNAVAYQIDDCHLIPPFHSKLT